MTVTLIGLSKIPLVVNGCVHGCLSCMLPCNGLATCPRCTPPLAHRLLEICTSYPAAQYGRSLYRKWMDVLPNENAIKPCFVSLLFDITRSVSPPHVKSVGLRRNCCMFAIMLFAGFLIRAAASITRCLLTEEIKQHNYFDQPFPRLT
ncbi:hypothetical protein ATANTOWER_015495 [Ataeniobius toweri]|uniref:Uncharacterized protein n=1 Tax=Ataeniobius toweri TaxID=208326 RepID=A0ABU7C9P2_9TELE|nr:hypothetical protein [Ataeniobius toweri]